MLQKYFSNKFLLFNRYPILIKLPPCIVLFLYSYSMHPPSSKNRLVEKHIARPCLSQTPSRSLFISPYLLYAASLTHFAHAAFALVPKKPTISSPQ